MKFQLICDSSCDLGNNFTTRENVEIVPLSVSFDGETYYKDGVEITSNEFFEKLISDPSIMPKSSLPQVQDYIDVFEKYVKENMPVICTTISAKFSGSYNSACMARDQILEDYPDARIEVYDSTHNTVCFGLFANEIVKMRNADMTIDEAIAAMNKIVATGKIYFTIGSFAYLDKGGRLGKAVTTAGDKLGIKPIIIMSNGSITVGGIKRSRKKAKERVIELIEEHFAQNNLDKSQYNFYVGYCYDKEEALEFEKEVCDRLGVGMCTDFDGTIGVVSGVHTGPYALGVGLIKRYDVD